jgi:hypothetical protein
LDINNRLSAGEVRLKASILAPQGGKFLGEGISGSFRTPLLRGESL